MSTAISRQRCFNHAHREAAVRCPQCRRYYCRECVVEHENRFLCASCLAESTADTVKPEKRMRWLYTLFSVAVGLLLIWSVFLVIGLTLTHLPSPTHDTDIWEQGWGDD